ncbi:MAG: hypothetical protein ABIP93_09440 [Gemmatimonadaceae bacterium]
MRAAFVAAMLLISACEIEKVAIPVTEARLATHGVLSASASTQVVLLERTRNGSIQLIAPPFDLRDPIVTDEGVAETGAIVRLEMPGGRMLLAREDNLVSGDASGRGVYRFLLPGASLERNVPYRLSVLTRKGEALRGETAVPGGVVAPAAEPRQFDRARDTAFIQWPAASGARSYYVRIETPFGPRAFFTDSTRVRLTGDLRNVELRSLAHVFIPGFPQIVTVSAVDSNFYDWYRTHNDPLSGAGLVSRVTGGFGFFGSLVRLHFQELRVVAPQSEPVAGKFRVVGSALEVSTTPYLSLDVYVESPSARSDQPDALSGQFQKRPTFSNPGCQICGLLGNSQGGRINLYFLRDWSAADTAEVFTGEIRGDTIVGSYRGFGGVARFVRAR